LIKKFRDVTAEIYIWKILGCKNKEHWRKIGMHVIKYKENWGRIVRKNEGEVEIHFR
jgi:hypothetical protein